MNPLFQHVKDDDVDRVRNDLIAIFPRNERDEEGKTPLHYARSRAVASALLEPRLRQNYNVINPIDINARDNGGYTPLMRAIHIGYDDVANYLIDQNADVNVVGNDGVTARSIRPWGEIHSRLALMGAIVGVENTDWMEALGLGEPVEFELQDNIGGEVVGSEFVGSNRLPSSGFLNVPEGKEDPVDLEPIRNGNIIVNWTLVKGNGTSPRESAPPPAGTGSYYHAATYNGLVNKDSMRSPLTRNRIKDPKKYTARIVAAKGGKRGRARGRSRKTRGRGRSRKTRARGGERA